ncbi:ABC transporter permease subunit [Arsenicicoccus cauae]|uniref:ABC transporter permease subunit n=1 Tax=Arsenicicoccus cauae TaxID=2663847 RepID=UPI00370D9A2A
MSRTSAPALVLKWGGIALAMALVFWIATRMSAQGMWLGVSTVAFVGLCILAVYATRRAVPMKYLLPGFLCLLALQIWPIIFTIMVSFTNYGDGHLGTKDEAVKQIVANSVQVVPGSTRYKASVAVKEGTDPATGALSLLLTDPQGKSFVGDANGLTDLADADVEKSALGRITKAGGYTVLTGKQANARSKDLGQLAVPSKDGSGIKMQGLSAAYEGRATITYDAASDTLTDTKSKLTYKPQDSKYVATDGSGQSFSQGWQENVGTKNYATIFSDSTMRSGFLKMFVWNVVFAAGTVISTFILGMLIALLFNSPNLKGKAVYRTLLILPYAIPVFVTALLWRGMFNQDYGLINTLTGLDVDWLGNGFWAKVAILITNLWLGFPYMFLLCTGALQSIPSDVKEAAKIDGAGSFQTLTRITMPLLMVAVGPLLIASYGFNFNNFTLIYLLTEGGPFEGGSAGMGSTDLLVTYAYRLAFSGAAPNFGLASAVAVVIFALVAIQALPGFRATKSLEEVQ